MADRIYQLNAYLAVLIVVAGGAVCLLAGGLLSLVIPQRAAMLVTLVLLTSLFGFMKSKTRITPGSLRSIRFIGIVIGALAILSVVVLMLLDWAGVQF